MSEKELIETFVRRVAERDPDVIEGHNLCRFDLPYLEQRARRHRVKLALGRDGSVCRKRSSRFTVAERIINYTRYDVFGRHVVDTLHLAMFYDAANRNLESYNLKYLARHFGFASETRTYVDGARISELWRTDRDTLLAYALDDVRETEALSRLLSPSYFYQTSLLPLTYQDVIVRGNGTSLDAMFVAEYVKRRHSLPFPEPVRRFSGALTRADAVGIFRDVWHCDIRSLYPSIILAQNGFRNGMNWRNFRGCSPRFAPSGSRPRMLPVPKAIPAGAPISRRCREHLKSRSTPSTATSDSVRARSTTSTWPNG